MSWAILVFGLGKHYLAHSDFLYYNTYIEEVEIMTVCSTLFTKGNLLCFWLKNRSYCSLGITKTQLMAALSKAWVGCSYKKSEGYSYVTVTPTTERKRMGYLYFTI